jgi:hypothetical protein
MGQGVDPITDRTLSWYGIVYIVFLTGICPAVVFPRNLAAHRRGEPARFSRFTCWLGLFTASLMWIGMPGVLVLMGLWPPV